MLVGPSGCGKTTAMRMVNRMIDITDGDILLDGESVKEPQAGRAAARDRLRDPADRPVPAPDDRRQHRHRAQAAGLGQAAHLHPGGRAAGAGLARSLRDPRPLPRPALRRPAPARRRGPRTGRRPAADAHGRALRRHRPDQPRAAAERVPAPPEGDPQDDRLRHPRHRRGDQDGRQDRRAAEGRQAGPVRLPRRAADVPGLQVRRGVRGRRPRAQAPGAPAREGHRPVEGRPGARGRDERRRARARSTTPTSRATCWWSTTSGRPHGWLARQRPGQRARARDRPARAPTWRWTTSCATRCPTC